jgi:arylsulfatase A
VAILYGMLARMDRGIARILQRLRELGLEDDTIVIFSSDNGPDFGGAGDEALVRFGGGLSGSKQDVLEGGIRVPAVIRWPGGLPGGARIDAPLHFADWLPTILAMTGTRRAPGGLPLDGTDALEVLRGEQTLETREFEHCWQWSRYEPMADCNAAIRDGDWKLVRPWRDGAREVPDGEWLMVSMYGPEHFIHHGVRSLPFPDRHLGEPKPARLFHLADDPGEQHDLATVEPDRVARMGRRLDEWFADVEHDRASVKDAT